MRGARKVILSVRISILSSRSCGVSTRVCLKYDQCLDRRKITWDFNNSNENPLFILVGSFFRTTIIVVTVKVKICKESD